jgi:uncharacterized membrane protein
MIAFIPLLVIGVIYGLIEIGCPFIQTLAKMLIFLILLPGAIWLVHSLIHGV